MLQNATVTASSVFELLMENQQGVEVKLLPPCPLSTQIRVKSTVKMIGKTPDHGDKKNVEITVPFKYLSNFCRTLEMLLVN